MSLLERGQNTLKWGTWNARKCNSCFIIKPLDNFYLHSNGKPRKQCKDCHYIRGQRWRSKNRSRVNSKRNDNFIKNPEKYEKQLESARKWRSRNKEYDSFRSKLYETTKRRQCPVWADMEKIKQIYLNRPVGFHVDHVIPLRGKNVCGLHVETNLQYLPASENMSKKNESWAE